MVVQQPLKTKNPFPFFGICYVYTEAGESVAEKLIREGLGKAWERDGQHRDLLMAAGRCREERQERVMLG